MKNKIINEVMSETSKEDWIIKLQAENQILKNKINKIKEVLKHE